MSGAARVRVFGAIALVVVVAGALAFFFLGRGGDDDDRRDRRLDPGSGRRHATTACAAFDDVITMVRDDEGSDAVLDRLEEAEEAAADAAVADPAWIDLSGALGGLEVGFRENDGEATRLSVAVARRACERARSGEG